MSKTNLWAKFASLTPEAPLLIAQIVSHNADGTSSAQLPDDSIIRAQGQSIAIGQKAFIRDGRIEGQAPELQIFNVAV